MSQLRVVTCRQKLRADTVRIIKQLAELDAVVAHHTRVWRATNGILFHKVIDDAAEFGFEVQSIKRNVQSFGNPAAVLCIGSTTATLLVVGTLIEDRQQRRR